MRADAARRRTEIVRAARHLFAQHGKDVALETVAAAAGVGIATLYRNFTSRTALADEVALAILSDIGAAADEMAARPRDETEAAWTDFVGRLVDLELGALSAALAEHITDDLSVEVRTAQDDALAAVDRVLTTARDASLVRADVAPLELVLAVGLLTRPLPEPVTREVPDLVPRLVDILLAGMRP